KNAGPCRPAVSQLGRVDARLGRATLGDGFTLETPPLPWRRLAPEGCLEAFELLLQPLVDLVAASGEGGEQRVGRVGDLGDPVERLSPRHTQPSGQLGAQRGVVQRGQRALVMLDRSCVERQPAAVRGDDPVRYYDVGVELGVERPAGVLPESRRDDAVGDVDAYLTVDAVAGVGMGLD